MTVVDDVGAAPASSRRRRSPWVIGVAVVVAATIAIGLSVWLSARRTGVRLLTGYPTYGTSGPIAIGEPRYYGSNLVAEDTIEHPDRHGRLSLQVSSIKARVTTNTARADVRVKRCVLAVNSSGPLGDDSGLSRCSSLTPFTSGDVTLGYVRGDDDIVLEITPRQAGVVRVAGVDVTYDAGSRSGTQHTGVEVSVRAR